MESMNHEEAGLLLPWLGTDRLDQKELELLLEHLKHCAECRGELRHLADLGRFVELADNDGVPGDAEIERRLAAVMTRLEPAGASRFGSWRKGGTAVWAFAALLLLAVGLYLSGSSRAPIPPLYQTLSSEKPAPAPGEKLRVVFADSCSLGELRGLLLAAGAEIVAGPSQRGVYTLSLSVPAGAEAPGTMDLIASWRTQGCFEFVEKVAAES